MKLLAVIVDRHGELRSGWRVLLFMLVAGILTGSVLLPLEHFKVATDFSLRVFALIAVVVATLVMTRFINRKPFAAIGLSLHPAMFRELGVGCLLGFLMVTGIFAVEYLLGYAVLQWRDLSALEYLWVFISAAVTFLVAAAFEELFFRGYPFQTLIQGITFFPAMLVMATLFILAHTSNPNVNAFGLVNVGLAAVWLSFAYFKTRSLWLPIGLHFSWNFSETTLFSYPTSGIRFEGLSLTLISQTGPGWLNGGSFGPEGGALATVALMFSTWYILKSKSLAAPEGIVTLDSPEDLLPAAPSGLAEGSRTEVS